MARDLDKRANPDALKLTMNVYVKSVSESETAAMDSFSEKLETCNVLSRSEKGTVN
jgi:hypothetical protein